MKKAIGEARYCAELSVAQLGRARNNGIEGRLHVGRVVERVRHEVPYHREEVQDLFLWAVAAA